MNPLSFNVCLSADADRQTELSECSLCIHVVVSPTEASTRRDPLPAILTFPWTGGCNIIYVSLCKTVSNKCEWKEFCVEMSVIPLFTKICSSRLELTAGLSGLCGFFKRIKSIIFVQLQLHLTRWGRARSFNLTDHKVLVQC